MNLIFPIPTHLLMSHDRYKPGRMEPVHFASLVPGHAWLIQWWEIQRYVGFQTYLTIVHVHTILVCCFKTSPIWFKINKNKRNSAGVTLKGLSPAWDVFCWLCHGSQAALCNSIFFCVLHSPLCRYELPNCHTNFFSLNQLVHVCVCHVNTG